MATGIKIVCISYLLEGSVLIFVTKKLNSEELSQNLKKNDFERMSCVKCLICVDLFVRLSEEQECCYLYASSFADSR